MSRHFRSFWSHPAKLYDEQIAHRADEKYGRLQSVFAISFRPHGDSPSFGNGNHIRTIGTTTMAVLSYETRGEKRRMPFRGFVGEVDREGQVQYVPPVKFLFDGALSPYPNAVGEVIDRNNKVMLDWLLQMDYACERELQGNHRLHPVPALPRIWLGFAADDLPEFEATPALQRQASARLGISVDMPKIQVPSNPIERDFMRNLWQEHTIAPNDPKNPTGLWLVDAEFCTHASKALRVFEDFSALMGVKIRNPARAVQAELQKSGESLEVDNPACVVLASHDLEATPDMLDKISAEKLDAMEITMRAALAAANGPSASYTQDEIYDALVNPHRRVTAWTEITKRMRPIIRPYYRSLVSDADLLRAAKNPESALVVSGACEVQVCKAQATTPAEAFAFTPAVLRRRIETRLWVEHMHEGVPTEAVDAEVVVTEAIEAELIDAEASTSLDSST